MGADTPNGLTIAQALTLRGAPDSYERLESLWLLADILNLDALQLKLDVTRPLSKVQQQQFLDGVARLEQGEPLGYIVGHQPFWTLDLRVTPNTLIPRPDSEIIIETALKLPIASDAVALDMGTGSGALALALASERPNWQVYATDIHPATLEVAQYNALVHHLSGVQFIRSHWYQQLGELSFDLIVSNPPYIADDDPHLATLHVEPRRALVAAQGGIADLEAIISGAKYHLNSNGWLILEHGYQQAAQVRTLLAVHQFHQIQTIQDYGGNERVSLGQLVV